MSYVSVGDMAQSFSFNRKSYQLKTNANRLGNELASGRVSDLSKRFSGDFTVISGIESSLKTLESYKVSQKEAAQFSDSMQISLGVVQDQTTKAASTLLLTGSAASQTQVNNIATDVRQAFDTVVATLNTQVGGRSLFAGAATDKPAVASASTMLADLQVAIAGQTTAGGVASAVDDWFNLAGGGFETSGYLGSTTSLSAFNIAGGQQADLSVTAADPTFRETLKNLALAALVSEGALAGDLAGQAELLERAGNGLLSIGDAQTNMRANLGTAEARIETALVQTTAEISALEITRTGLLEVDPYSAASELEQVQTQLETLYALTSRMSRMSLVDFLK